MKEKIILAPGANRTELIRSLALHGQGSFGLRIYSSAYSLAEDVLLRKGIINESVVQDNTVSYLIADCMKNIPAFQNASFTDAENIASSLKTLRSLIVRDEDEQMARLVSESAFAQKNKNLLDVYKLYRKKLAGRKDAVDIIRQALQQEYDIEAEFIVLNQFPLLPLEKALLEKMSNNNVRKMNLTDLFGLELKPYQNIQYIKAYGSSNEVENTLQYIFKNDLNLDDCVVAVTDSGRYDQLFLEYSQKYNLDVTFVNGININSTNPVKLLRLYHQWDVKGYHGIDALVAMLNSPSFDRDKLINKCLAREEERFDQQQSDKIRDINKQALLDQHDRIDLRKIIKNLGDKYSDIENEEELYLTVRRSKDGEYRFLKNMAFIAGRLKLDGNLNENIRKVNDIPRLGYLDRIDLMVLAEELGKDCNSFISEYSIIEDEKDEEALRVINNTINGYLNYCPKGSYTDVYDRILSRKVGRSVSREGSLIISDIKGALSQVRRHLFVLGLSADIFPGSSKENYLLLDDDLKLYVGNNDIPVSSALMKRKKDNLFDLLTLYSSLNVEIRVSYSCYDMAGVKGKNASSVLFDIYCRQNVGGTIDGFETVLKNNETSYLHNDISISGEAIKSLTSNQVIAEPSSGEVIYKKLDESERAFSPSALENFFTCPKRFYFISILGLEEPDPDNPLDVINARDMGTLVHKAMEYIADNPDASESEFREAIEKMFDEYLKTRRPIDKNEADNARREFVTMAVNGYHNDPGNEVMASEEREYVRHTSSGITIYGFPDRVEKDKDGKYLIADYKTKRKYEHKEDDINTCLQVVLYAYMLSHRRTNPLKISYCTYRYLRYAKPVNCVYNQAIEKQLEEKLLQVKEALDSGYFPCTTNKDNCRYCKFCAICDRDKVEEGTEHE